MNIATKLQALLHPATHRPEVRGSDPVRHPGLTGCLPCRETELLLMAFCVKDQGTDVKAKAHPK